MVAAYVSHYDGEEVAAWWDRTKTKLARVGKSKPGDVKAANV
jgi:hypothetical protein